MQGLGDTKYATTSSNEITTERVIPLIDLLPRPILQVTRVGLQMVIFFHLNNLFNHLYNQFQVNLAWKFGDSVNQSSIKGYRIILNTKPTETLSPNQHEYELRDLKPGISFIK